MKHNIDAINIMGTRGVPATHGGFETFAQNFASFVVKEGCQVTVYCQGERARRPKLWIDRWEGINRVHVQTRFGGAIGTVEYDFRCVLDVLRRPGVDLVLGYNTAVFNVLQRLFGRKVVMNMDGIEWKRSKWGPLAKSWFWLNEWIGAQTCSIPIADHPDIKRHLAHRGCNRAEMITYGAEPIKGGDIRFLQAFGLAPNSYFLVVARVEPENSILDIVRAFTLSGVSEQLVVLGNVAEKGNAYHEKIRTAANDRVSFLGAVYDRDVVSALRYHARAYVHGHQVGGTNPSLVEALAAGNPIIAHDNRFNRWSTQEAQLYFRSIDDCAEAFKLLSRDPDQRVQFSSAALETHRRLFDLEAVNRTYLQTLVGEGQSKSKADANTAAAARAGANAP